MNKGSGDRIGAISPCRHSIWMQICPALFRCVRPAIGSPGGPTIINTVLQVIVHIVDFGFTIQEAIDAPRVHHQWLPDELRVENHGFPEDVIRGLEARGHRLVYRGFMGDAEGIMLDPKSGLRLGASDPRGDGLAIGY